MKKLQRLFTARPALYLGILIWSLGIMVNPLHLSAKDLDEDILLESWMITPFENDFAEFEIQLENWMTTPFEIEFSEFDIQMEGWMTEDWI